MKCKCRVNGQKCPGSAGLGLLLSNLDEAQSCAIQLLVEDSDDDALFFMRAVTRSDAATRVLHVRDGVHAIEHLSKLGDAAEPRTSPELIVTDLKMPRCAPMP